MSKEKVPVKDILKLIILPLETHQSQLVLRHFQNSLQYYTSVTFYQTKKNRYEKVCFIISLTLWAKKRVSEDNSTWRAHTSSKYINLQKALTLEPQLSDPYLSALSKLISCPSTFCETIHVCRKHAFSYPNPSIIPTNCASFTWFRFIKGYALNA